MLDVTTLNDFRDALRAEKQHATYTQMVAKYGVNKWHLWNIIHDDNFIPSSQIAAQLHLVVMRPAPACPDCGQLHVIKDVCLAHCIVDMTLTQATEEELSGEQQRFHIRFKESAGVKRRRARASINLEDPHSAAQTIIHKMDRETIAALTRLLAGGE